jgi:hypothetical protein
MVASHFVQLKKWKRFTCKFVAISKNRNTCGGTVLTALKY